MRILMLMQEFVNYILIAIFLLCCFLITVKLIRSKFASLKTVKAEVFDKYKPDAISKYPENWKSKSCFVVFKTKDKKLSFNISEYSYNIYRIGEKGTLKYKGSKIISFR